MREEVDIEFEVVGCQIGENGWGYFTPNSQYQLSALDITRALKVRGGAHNWSMREEVDIEFEVVGCQIGENGCRGGYFTPNHRY